MIKERKNTPVNFDSKGLITDFAVLTLSGVAIGVYTGQAIEKVTQGVSGKEYSQQGVREVDQRIYNDFITTIANLQSEFGITFNHDGTVSIDENLFQNAIRNTDFGYDLLSLYNSSTPLEKAMHAHGGREFVNLSNNFFEIIRRVVELEETDTFGDTVTNTTASLAELTKTNLEIVYSSVRNSAPGIANDMHEIGSFNIAYLAESLLPLALFSVMTFVILIKRLQLLNIQWHMYRSNRIARQFRYENLNGSQAARNVQHSVEKLQDPIDQEKEHSLEELMQMQNS